MTILAASIGSFAPFILYGVMAVSSWRKSIHIPFSEMFAACAISTLAMNLAFVLGSSIVPGIDVRDTPILTALPTHCPERLIKSVSTGAPLCLQLHLGRSQLDGDAPVH